MTYPIGSRLLPPSPKFESQNDSVNSSSAPRRAEKNLARVDRSRVDPQIVKAAEGLESLFLDQMMQVMRKGVERSELSLDNSASDIYRGMLDTEYSKIAAHTGGVGLADQIIEYLQSTQYTKR